MPSTVAFDQAQRRAPMARPRSQDGGPAETTSFPGAAVEPGFTTGELPCSPHRAPIARLAAARAVIAPS